MQWLSWVSENSPAKDKSSWEIFSNCELHTVYLQIAPLGQNRLRQHSNFFLLNNSWLFRIILKNKRKHKLLKYYNIKGVTYIVVRWWTGFTGARCFIGGYLVDQIVEQCPDNFVVSRWWLLGLISLKSQKVWIDLLKWIQKTKTHQPWHWVFRPSLYGCEESAFFHHISMRNWETFQNIEYGQLESRPAHIASLIINHPRPQELATVMINE